MVSAGFEFGRRKVVTRFRGARIVWTAYSLTAPWWVVIKNLWYLDALKRSNSELILPEKPWNGIKSLKLLHIYQNVRTFLWRLQHQIALRTMNLPELPPGFLQPHPFPNTLVMKDKRISIFCGKITLYILYHHFKYEHIHLFF